MIARFQHRHQRPADRRHAAGGGKGVLRPFKCCDTVFEHGDGGVAVAGIDEFIGAGLLKPCFGLFGAVIDEPLGEKDRLAHFTILAAARAAMNGLGARIPIITHCAFPFRPAIADNKKPQTRSSERGLSS